MLDVWKFTFLAGTRVGYDIIPIGKNINRVVRKLQFLNNFHIKTAFF